MSGSLHAYVIAQLEASKGTWPEVAAATGISKRTIEKIASGVSADPGVIKIEKLAAYFRSRARQEGGPRVSPS